MDFVNDHLRMPVQKRDGARPADELVWSDKISRLENAIMNQPEDER